VGTYSLDPQIPPETFTSKKSRGGRYLGQAKRGGGVTEENQNAPPPTERKQNGKKLGEGRPLDFHTTSKEMVEN